MKLNFSMLDGATSVPPTSPIKTNDGTSEPMIGAVPHLSHNVPPKNTESEAIRESFEERAAIIEFDAGLSREEAEVSANEVTLSTTGHDHVSK